MSIMPDVVLPGLSFTAIDFELANPKHASACAVGLVKVRDGLVVDSLDTLIQPPPGHGSFFWRNVEIHKITANHVVGAPGWGIVYNQVAAFADGDPFVAHNASFDRSVFEQTSQAYGIRVPRTRWLCTRDAAKSVLDLTAYKLPIVSAALNIPAHAHHDAGADARQCALVLIALCRKLGPESLDLLRHHIKTR